MYQTSLQSCWPSSSQWHILIGMTRVSQTMWATHVIPAIQRLFRLSYTNENPIRYEDNHLVVTPLSGSSTYRTCTIAPPNAKCAPRDNETLNPHRRINSRGASIKSANFTLSLSTGSGRQRRRRIRGAPATLAAVTNAGPARVALRRERHRACPLHLFSHKAKVNSRQMNSA